MLFGCIEQSKQAAPAQQNLKEASNQTLLKFSNYEFSIEYPKTWNVSTPNDVVVFSFASKPQNIESVTVVIEPTSLSLEQFIEQILGPYIGQPTFKLLDVSWVNLSGGLANRVVYTDSGSYGSRQYLQIFTVKNNKAAILTFTSTPAAYERFLPEVEGMFNSFTFATNSLAVQLPASLSMAPELVGKWSVYSQSIYYDSGNWSLLDSYANALLELRADQTWTFENLNGTWSVQPIEKVDWQKWGVSSNGQTRKLVLNKWSSSNQTVDGPIEEANSTVDATWIIYRVGPPAAFSPAQVQIKFRRMRG